MNNKVRSCLYYLVNSTEDKNLVDFLFSLETKNKNIEDYKLNGKDKQFIYTAYAHFWKKFEAIYATISEKYKNSSYKKRKDKLREETEERIFEDMLKEGKIKLETDNHGKLIARKKGF